MFSRDLQRSVNGTKGSTKALTIRNLPRDTDAPQRDSVICFLERLSNATADQMPDTGKSTSRTSRKLLFTIGSIKSTHAYAVMRNCLRSLTLFDLEYVLQRSEVQKDPTFHEVCGVRVP